MAFDFTVHEDSETLRLLLETEAIARRAGTFPKFDDPESPRGYELQITRELEAAQRYYELTLDEPTAEDTGDDCPPLVFEPLDLEDDDPRPDVALVREATAQMRTLWPVEWDSLWRVADAGGFQYDDQDDAREVGRVLDTMHADLLSRLAAAAGSGDARAVSSLGPDARLFVWLVGRHLVACGQPDEALPWLRARFYGAPEYRAWDYARLRLVKATEGYKTRQRRYDHQRAQDPGRRAREAERQRRRRASARSAP